MDPVRYSMALKLLWLHKLCTRVTSRNTKRYLCMRTKCSLRTLNTMTKMQVRIRPIIDAPKPNEQNIEEPPMGGHLPNVERFSKIFAHHIIYHKPNSQLEGPTKPQNQYLSPQAMNALVRMKDDKWSPTEECVQRTAEQIEKYSKWRRFEHEPQYDSGCKECKMDLPKPQALTPRESLLIAKKIRMELEQLVKRETGSDGSTHIPEEETDSMSYNYDKFLEDFEHLMVKIRHVGASKHQYQGHIPLIFDAQSSLRLDDKKQHKNFDENLVWKQEEGKPSPDFKAVFHMTSTIALHKYSPVLVIFSPGQLEGDLNVKRLENIDILHFSFQQTYPARIRDLLALYAALQYSESGEGAHVFSNNSYMQYCNKIEKFNDNGKKLLARWCKYNQIAFCREANAYRFPCNYKESFMEHPAGFHFIANKELRGFRVTQPKLYCVRTSPVKAKPKRNVSETDSEKKKLENPAEKTKENLEELPNSSKEQVL